MAAMPRITWQTEAVFNELLARYPRPAYGMEIGTQVGLRSGTLQPLLARWERSGVLVSEWEDWAAAEGQGRPRRRYYQFTADGADFARAALAALAAKRQPAKKRQKVEGP